MKIFRLFTMLMLGFMLNVNLTSRSKEDIVPDTEQGENNDGSEEGSEDDSKDEDEIVYPNGIPSDIPNNIIYYITSDYIILRFQNEDVFGGAKIVSNTYSSTDGYGTIEFASEVTAIEREAFKNQGKLTYIALPNSVKSIGVYAFSGCSGLTSVIIGNSVTSIGAWTFYKCYELLDVYCYAENVPSTDSNTFRYSPIADATLHVPATSVDSYKATAPWSGFGKIVALTPEETGIDELKGENGKVKTDVYDLSGRCVQKGQKGIFIQNGKVVVK